MSNCDGDLVDGLLANNNSFSKPREKIIIDTDPGIDDSMTILMAFQTPEVEIIGLTTIFGNVTTKDATRNALILCEAAGYPDVPVAEGSPEPLKRGEPRVADFVHGSDGLGNLYLPSPNSMKIDKSASEFLVEKVSEFPGEVSILALGPLTNLALAVKRDSTFASKVKRVVVLGGSFFALGNVNPAAEANVGEFLPIGLNKFYRIHIVLQYGSAMLVGSSKTIAASVSDHLKMHSFWRIRHTPSSIFEEFEQHSVGAML